MTLQLREQLSAADAEVILERLPERIRAALIAHAAEIEYPIEAVVEMAHSPVFWTRRLWDSLIAIQVVGNRLTALSGSYEVQARPRYAVVQGWEIERF